MFGRINPFHSVRESDHFIKRPTFGYVFTFTSQPSPLTRNGKSIYLSLNYLTHRMDERLRSSPLLVESLNVPFSSEFTSSRPSEVQVSRALQFTTFTRN